MNKKIIVSLLALVLVAGLTACTNPLQKEDSVATGNVEVNDEVAGNLDIVEEVMDANEKVVEKDAPEMNVVAGDVVVTGVDVAEMTGSNEVLPEAAE